MRPARTRIARIAAVGLVGASLAVAGLAGCGDSTPAASGDATTAAATSGTDGANGEPRMTAAAYRTAADGICQTSSDAADKLDAPKDAATFKAYAGQLGGLVQDEVDGLSGLYPPQELAAAHQKLVDAGNSLAKAFANAASQVKSSTTSDQAVALLKGTGITTAHDDAVAAAKELGLTTCFPADSGSDSTS